MTIQFEKETHSVIYNGERIPLDPAEYKSISDRFRENNSYEAMMQTFEAISRAKGNQWPLQTQSL